MGWAIDWVSGGGNEFNRDLGFLYTRGLEFAMAYYPLLDRTPSGRAEPPDEPLWLRRHDEY